MARVMAMAGEPNGHFWLNRRALLRASGLVGAIAIIGTGAPTRAAQRDTLITEKSLAAFLAISADNRIMFTSPAAEIGQGIGNSLAQILADSLDVEWAAIDLRIAGAGEVFNNPGKKTQSVGQSYSIRGYHDLIRDIGAAARTNLIAAAAARWQVAAADCTTATGVVHHRASGRSLRYADVAAEAQKLAPPAQMAPRPERRLVGERLLRLDTPAKVRGETLFGLDVRLPGMLQAAVALAPVTGGKLAGYDRSAALAVPGVVAVIETKRGLVPGLAVLAERWWTARRGLDAAAPQFTASFADEVAGSEALRRTILSGLDRAPIPVAGKGAPEAFAAAPGVVFEAPFLAHAAMEPLTALADVRDGGCDLWAAVQSQTKARDEIAASLGIAADKVIIHSLPAGGSFGRRWYSDFALLAAELSAAAGRPVKLILSREQDMACDMYRPAFAMRGRAKVAGGRLSGLDLHLAGPSISEFGRPGRLNGKFDPIAVSGLRDMPYSLDDFRLGWTSTPTPVPIGVWRSVGHGHNGFFLESLVDEAARDAGIDPLVLRKASLAGEPRAQAVLDAVGGASGWGRTLAAGHGLGVAFAESYGSFVAQVAEVSVRDHVVRLEHVWAAVDCGTAINPAGVEAQIESGIIFGLTAALWGDVGFAAGATIQSNFNDYRVAQLKDVPPISIIIVNSGEALGGAGEPGLVPIAAAITNAIAAAGGERIRRLPLATSGWELA